MTPRELVAGFLGLIVGVLVAEFGAPACRRACCVTEARRQRWREGEDVADGPRRRSQS